MYTKYTVIYSDQALAHHGVLGMKWGVWNDETRARYSGHKRRKQEKKDRYAEKKNVRSMSDKELQDKITRLRNEKTYRELLEEDIHPGRLAVKNVLVSSAKTVGKIAATAAGIAALAAVAYKFQDSNTETANLYLQQASMAQSPERAAMLNRQAQMYQERANAWNKFNNNLRVAKK